MAISQKLVKEKLEEWAKLQIKIGSASAKKNKELDPFIREHNERIAPIIEKHDKKIEPLTAKANALEKEIQALMLANTDKDGKPIPLMIDCGTAKTTLSEAIGARVVSVEKFFAAVKTKTAEFWDALTVGVAKADKILGKAKVDEISLKKTNYIVSLQLNK